MNERNNTNSGVIFQPHTDQALVGQGKINIEGSEARLVVIKEPLKRDGKAELVIYQKVGVLFVNDRKDNEAAPQFSGPLDLHPNKRVAAWTGEKDGRRYMSLRVSDKQPRADEGGSAANTGTGGWGSGPMPDDEIPF